MEVGDMVLYQASYYDDVYYNAEVIEIYENYIKPEYSLVEIQYTKRTSYLFGLIKRTKNTKTKVFSSSLFKYPNLVYGE